MKTRREIILPYLQNKRVLDCGGTQYKKFNEIKDQGTWFHDTICDHATSVLGIDIDVEAVNMLNESGYNFIAGNVEEMSFKEEFDIVIGGELIEHLGCPGQFLKCAYDALVQNGLLILTTPNIFSFTILSKHALSGNELTHPEHVSGYSKQLITHLLSRYSFANIEVKYCDRVSKNKLLRLGRNTASIIFPHFSEKIVAIGVKTNCD